MHQPVSDDEDLYWSCIRKKRLSDEKLARQVAHRASERAGIPIRWYGCTSCGGYHLTKRPKEKEKP